MGKITKLEALVMLEADDFDNVFYGRRKVDGTMHLCPAGMVARERGAQFHDATFGLVPESDSVEICHQALKDVARFMIKQGVFEVNGHDLDGELGPEVDYYNVYTDTKVKAAIMRWRAMMIENAREKEEVGV
jgi:hypothetical protein